MAVEGPVGLRATQAPQFTMTQVGGIGGFTFSTCLCIVLFDDKKT